MTTRYAVYHWAGSDPMEIGGVYQEDDMYYLDIPDDELFNYILKLTDKYQLMFLKKGHQMWIYFDTKKFSQR